MQISPLMFLPKMAEIANLCLLLISWDYGDPEPDYKCYLLSVLGSFAVIVQLARLLFVERNTMTFLCALIEKNGYEFFIPSKYN